MGRAFWPTFGDQDRAAKLILVRGFNYAHWHHDHDHDVPLKLMSRETS